MKRYRITRTLSMESVRQVCINHNYYTRGTCQEYEDMFKDYLTHKTEISGSNITSRRLHELAMDIKDHSETEDTIEDIMSNLVVHITCSLFILED